MARKSNIELLRILAILMIVGVHFASYSGISSSFSLNPNYMWLTMLSHGGKIGVALFTLISAYFLSRSEFKWKKLAKLYFDVFFYSLVIFVVCSIIFGRPGETVRKLG